MKKRHLILSLVLALCLGLAAPTLAVEYGAELNPNEKTYTQRFSDVPTNHWAFQYVGELVERGAINGYPDGKFYPDKIVTREEFAKIMVVAAGLTAAPAKSSSYTDVDVTYWASPFIETAKPYMTAYQTAGGLTFRPRDGALREDIAVAVVKLKGYDTRLADLSIIQTMFSDVDAISAAAQPYVALAVENGIISGYVDGTFRGQATITRSEAAAMLWRAFQYGNDTKVIAAEATPTPKADPKPTVSAKPSPSPSDKPEPSPSPEPTKSEKPYIAERLAKATVRDHFSHMTIGENDNIIYFDSGKQQIISLDPNTSEASVLLDVKDATCDANGVTYTDLSVDQVFWDNAGHRLLVVGKLSSVAPSTGDDSWELSEGNGSCEGIFTLTDGSLAYTYQKPYASYPFEALGSALMNGSFVIKTSGYWYICDLESGQTGENLDHTGYTHCGVAQSGAGIYTWGRDDEKNYYKDNYIKRYNYNINAWDNIGKIHGNDGYMVGCQNDLLYIWGEEGIKAIRPNDAAKQHRLDPSKDVEVLDMNALPQSSAMHCETDRLFVTSDEQFIFYDSSANAIRVIRPNPNA